MINTAMHIFRSQLTLLFRRQATTFGALATTLPGASPPPTAARLPPPLTRTTTRLRIRSRSYTPQRSYFTIQYCIIEKLFNIKLICYTAPPARPYYTEYVKCIFFEEFPVKVLNFDMKTLRKA